MSLWTLGIEIGPLEFPMVSKYVAWIRSILAMVTNLSRWYNQLAGSGKTAEIRAEIALYEKSIDAVGKRDGRYRKLQIARR